MNSLVQKPWGSFRIIKKEENYLVKILLINPGGKLSLQSHEHRSEHWIIVKGIAKITLNETVKKMHQNESIFIPKQSKHRIENNNAEDLKIIEVQCGNILKEEDIIRYEDIYNRK